MSWKPKKKRRRPPPQRRLLVESLETRSLLSAVPITELIQGVHITPTASSGPTLTNVCETESIGSTLYILGQLNDEAAYQAVTLGAAPVINAPVTLPSLVSYLNPSTAVISAGQLRGVAAGANGEAEFYGWSYSPNATPGLGHDQPEATMWNLAGVPTAQGFIDQNNRLSLIYAVSANGVFAGLDGMTAFVGKIGLPSVALPNNSPGWIDAVLATTPDGSILVGLDGQLPAAWEGNSADLSSYHELTSSYASATDGSIPDMFWFTATDANGRAIGFGDYIQTATGADEAGAWDLRSGAFIQGFGTGTTIADAKLFGDTVVVGLNGPNGGLLATLYDPETLLLSQLPGLTGLTNPEILPGGLSQDASRNLMVAAQTAGGSLVVGGWVTTANPITQLVGAVVNTPTLWSGPVLDNLCEAQAVNNNLMLLGQINDEAAYQAVTLGATPVVNAPVTLPSLVSYLNPSTVISAGQLRGAVAGANGQIDVYGWSYSPNAKPGFGHAQPQGTEWPGIGVPTAVDFVDNQSLQSLVYTVSANGVFAGRDGMTAFVGKAGATSVALPDSTPGWIDAVLATTPDGRYLVGSNGPNAGAWTGNPADLTSYQLMTTAYTAIPNGGTADMYWFVINVKDAFGNDQPIAFGNTTDIATGKDVAAAWNVETGNYFASYGVGTTIADAVVAGAGQTPFVAVNGPNGGQLMSLDGTSSVLFKDLPGMAALGLTANPFFAHGGLAVDSAGNLIIAATTEDGIGSLIVGGWKVNPVVVNPYPWQNAALPSDVDGHSGVTPLDVLTVINYLNTVGSGPVPAAASGPPYFDVNGDGTVSPIDVLTVINYINNHGGTSSSAEGEAAPAFAAGTSTQPSAGISFAAGNRASSAARDAVFADASSSVFGPPDAGRKPHGLPSPKFVERVFRPTGRNHELIDPLAGLNDLLVDSVPATLV